MANTLASQLSAGLKWLDTNPLALSNLVESSALNFSLALASGTGGSQADQIWGYTNTLGAGVTLNIVLSALNQTIHGTSYALNMVTVRAIVVVNQNTVSGNYLKLTPNASNPFELPFNGQASPAGIRIGPNSVGVISNLVDGWATVASTSDSLALINPGATGIQYQLAILGTSA